MTYLNLCFLKELESRFMLMEHQKQQYIMLKIKLIIMKKC